MIGSIYKTKRWERVSKRKLAANPLCEGCEQRPSRNVDHIQPLDSGGAAYDPNNHQALCIPCHNDKTGCDKTGKHWVKPKHRGCDQFGIPRDPSHPWHGMGVQSLQASARGAAPTIKTRLVH